MTVTDFARFIRSDELLILRCNVGEEYNCFQCYASDVWSFRFCDVPVGDMTVRRVCSQEGHICITAKYVSFEE